MKKMIISLLAALAILPSCRKELCYNHWEHALSVKADLTTDYEQEWYIDYGKAWNITWKYEQDIPYGELCPKVPGGLAVISYGEKERQEKHIGPEGAIVQLQEGHQELLMYNDDTEYIIFRGKDASTTMTATTRTKTRASYTERNPEIPTVGAPDMLFSCYIPDYVGVKALEPVDLDVEMKPMVYTYYIRYEFDEESLPYLALARGSISGMAESVNITNGAVSENQVTILFDCQLSDYGCKATVNTFGRAAMATDCYLDLEIRLRNGKTIYYEYDISDQLEDQPSGGVIVIEKINIPKDQATAGSGGFDVEVEGWGDQVDITLPL